jgi:hypothetical protein
VVSLNPKNFIGNLIKLFHLAFSQQYTEILDVLSFFEDSSNHKFLLVLFNLVPVVVSDWDMLPTLFLLLCLVFQGLSDCLFWDILISRLAYSVLTH